MQTQSTRIGQANADGRGGGNGQYSPGPRRSALRRRESATRAPHWCSLLGLMELSDRVAGLWGSTVAVVEEPAPDLTVAPPKRLAPPPNMNAHLAGLYQATAPVLPAAPAGSRLHPMDLLAARY